MRCFCICLVLLVGSVAFGQEMSPAALKKLDELMEGMSKSERLFFDRVPMNWPPGNMLTSPSRAGFFEEEVYVESIQDSKTAVIRLKADSPVSAGSTFNPNALAGGPKRAEKETMILKGVSTRRMKEGKWFQVERSPAIATDTDPIVIEVLTSPKMKAGLALLPKPKRK